MFDDLFSGQPMGSAMLLWSVAMIALEAIEQRFPWRGYLLVEDRGRPHVDKEIHVGSCRGR